MYTIIELQGKQYKVKENDEIVVDRLDKEEKTELIIDKIIAIIDGKNSLFGKPYLTNIKVYAKILKHFKGKKIIVFKYKPKTRYKKKIGHRQLLTRLKIERIETADE